MQPLRRYPQPERPSNPSPLEMAIYNYELKAKAFYDKKAKQSNAADPVVEKHLNQDYKHLEKERERIESVIIVQQSLEAYRAEALKSDIETLNKEGHHPTDKLGKHLSAVGEFKPTAKHEAHHIIPGKGRFRQPILLRTRLRLHAHGVGINDPMNGVWLFGTEKEKEFDWATVDAASHRRIHRHNYESWIGGIFRAKRNKTDFINLLRNVKMKIKTGQMPENVMMPKDKTWDGVS